MFQSLYSFLFSGNPLQKIISISIFCLCNFLLFDDFLLLITFVVLFVTSLFVLRNIAEEGLLLNSHRLLPFMYLLDEVIDAIKLFFSQRTNLIYPNVISKDFEIELKNLLRLFYRDFVSSWVEELSSDNECFLVIKETVDEVTLNIIERLRNINVQDSVIKIVKVLYAHITQYQSANQAFVRQPIYRKKAGNKNEVKKIKNVAHAFKKKGYFHVAMYNESCEINYLRSISVSILDHLVSYEHMKCDSAQLLLTDVISHSVLEKLMDNFSAPYWLHTVIIDLLQKNADLNENSKPPFLIDEDYFSSKSIVDEIHSCEEMYSNQDLKNNSGLTRFVPFSEQLQKYVTVQSSSSNALEDILVLDNTTSLNSIHSDGGDTHSDIEDNLLHHELANISLANDAFLEFDVDINGSQPDFLFEEISIIKTKTLKERNYNKIFFTVYAIEYLSWHKIPSRESWNLKVNSVNRRFREFITLYERLDEEGSYKESLKDIKSPQRLKYFATNVLDQSTIQSRRIFLDAFLKKLISKIDICNSNAFKEFLAYESDGRLAYVRNSSDNFTQVLFETFQDVIKKVSDLPKSRGSKFSRSRKRSLSRRRRRKLKSFTDPDEMSIEFASKNSFQSVDTIEEDFLKCINSLNSLDEAESSDSFESAFGSDEEFEIVHTNFSKDNQDAKSKLDGSDCNNTDENIPLASAVLGIASLFFQEKNHWFGLEKYMSFLKILIGKLFDTWLANEIDTLFTEKQCALYLKLLRDTLWQNEVLIEEDEEKPTESEQAFMKDKCKLCLQEFLPWFVRSAIGKKQLNEVIDEILLLISHPKLNRHLFLCLFDVLMEIVFPEMNSSKHAKQAISSENRKKCETILSLC